MKIARAPSCALLGATLLAFGTVGFTSPAMAQGVVQEAPNPARAELMSAMQRISRNPRSVPALVDAGRASLDLGDISASLGFFNRAQAISPNDGRVLLGLGLVAVRRGEALTAIQLLNNAEAAGAPVHRHGGDRGLAYDLAGDNAEAQRLYRRDLTRNENPEVVRRLALSYAISGDGAASETTLLPLLQRQDRAAFRTRAFALAILGQREEAVSIAETMLPPRLANRLSPYFSYMPRLTRAQQAAAANLGQFPDASIIGQDDAQVAALSGNASRPATPATGSNDRLTPAGPPLGPAVRTSGGELPAIAAAVSQPATQPAAAPQPPARAPDPVVAATMPREMIGQSEARPSVSIREPITTVAVEPSTPAVEEAIAEAIPPTREPAIDLEQAFADFTLPGTRMPPTPSAGAVDITRIKPARETPRPAAVPTPPANPSRHWVQVATGQDVAAFRFDWRRIVRNANGLLDDRKAFTAPWNQTNRLVTGPFDSARDAQQFVSELGEAGVDSFRFTSEQGETVRPIG